MEQKQKKTSNQWWQVLNACKKLAMDKYDDYGGSVFVLRTPSMVDQIRNKCLRIISIQETKTQKIDDSINSEFVGIINYSIMGLMILEDKADEDLPKHEFEKLYDQKTETIHELMMKKNHDYGEAWRGMGETSFPDLIRQKLVRMKTMTENGGAKVSEDLDANYHDIINYAIFWLILEMQRGNFEVETEVKLGTESTEQK
ncbi:MAG TPA: DUF1599 domain-containing protein [Candidatus Absconditabacterales bacterium]|nr:DUF1599 domain-containing protein [Candidatus Absconditabacterales bacterium]HMT27582.1 DUF1599 domain-containing protein [Candidatus Absconditabacterales bacterium]